MPLRFKPNPNLRRDVENEIGFRTGLMRHAQTAANEANALGHRIMPKGRGPTVKVEADAEGVHIVNHAYGSHLDEWGSVKNPPYAPLRRGARAAGLRLDESSK